MRRTYAVDAIHCASRERRIAGAIGGIEGVESVAPDARSRRVDVRFDPGHVSEEEIISRLGEIGFPVTNGDDRAAGGVGRYALLVVGVGAVALAGYGGYVLYPRFDLPPVEGAAVFGLAATAGVASFFSPCSFPLLLGILGRQEGPAARGTPAVFGGALALGAGTFLLLAGLLIAAGGGVVFEQVTFDSATGITIRAVVGILLVVLGLVQIGFLRTPFHAVAAKHGTQRSRPSRRRTRVSPHDAQGMDS